MGNQIKQKLYQLCTDVIKQRIENAKQALSEIQEATENETKSSAGDKYETSREMMQQETDRSMQMLNEAKKQLVVLNSISGNGSHEIADTGSLVKTDKGSFYLSVSAGTLNLGSDKYFAVSVQSPVGVKLKGKKPGEHFELNGARYEVLDIA